MNICHLRRGRKYVVFIVRHQMSIIENKAVHPGPSGCLRPWSGSLQNRFIRRPHLAFPSNIKGSEISMGREGHPRRKRKRKENGGI
jgi:hypothetical protein